MAADAAFFSMPNKNGHSLLTPAEIMNDPKHNGQFDPDGEPSQLYLHVVDGGLSVCRHCREFEAGLDEPCTCN